MNFILTFFATSILFLSHALAGSISITDSSMDLNSQVFQITADISSFSHSSTASDYSVALGIENTSNSETANTTGSPTVFNGSSVGSNSPSCSGSSPAIHINDFELDTSADTISITALVCNITPGGSASDWSLSLNLSNSVSGDFALAFGTLQNFTDLNVAISFDSFDKVKLALDDGNGNLTIEATVSDLSFAASDNLDVTVNLANSDSSQSAAGDATATASDSDNAAFSGSATDCSALSGPNLVVENVNIATNGASKTISVNAKACHFKHGKTTTLNAWTVVLGITSASQAGSAQSNLTGVTLKSSLYRLLILKRIKHIKKRIARIKKQIKSAKNQMKRARRNRARKARLQRRIKSLYRVIRALSKQNKGLLSSYHYVFQI